MKVFNLPDLGEGLQDAEIVRWLVAEGDEVSVDQPMVEMETAKAVVEVPSPHAGVVSTLHGQAGDVILVGAPLISFDGAGESASSNASQPAEAQASTAPAASTQSPNTDAGEGRTFLLPDLGEGLQDAEIVRWLVAEGDSLKVDQPMVEMETAKAVVEVPAPYAGEVAELHGQAGDVILVGAPLISFRGEGGEKAKTPVSPKQEPPAKKAENADAGTVVGAVEVSDQVGQESASAVTKALARKLGVDLSQVQGSGKNGAITQKDVHAAAKSGTGKGTASNKNNAAAAPSQNAGQQKTGNPLQYRASPAVRALAKRLDVDLAQCASSGKKGSITRDDVKAAAKQVSSGGAVNRAVSAPSTAPAASAGQQSGNRLTPVTATTNPEPVRGVRRAMAQAMTKASQQVCLTTLVDDANIHAWKKGNNPTVRLIRALARACRSEPAMNAWFDGENMERLLHPEVNIGIAVDTADGLYVPVIRQADTKSADVLRGELTELIEKIKRKAIRPEDMADPTITLSNFGTIAGRYGTPVVVPPQVGILGSGAFKDELKLGEKGIELQRHIPLSLSFDHRACTGGEAARCLKAIMEDLMLAE